MKPLDEEIDTYLGLNELVSRIDEIIPDYARYLIKDTDRDGERGSEQLYMLHELRNILKHRIEHNKGINGQNSKSHVA